jgi:hypothetical protein
MLREAAHLARQAVSEGRNFSLSQRTRHPMCQSRTPTMSGTGLQPLKNGSDVGQCSLHTYGGFSL